MCNCFLLQLRLAFHNEIVAGGVINFCYNDRGSPGQSQTQVAGSLPAFQGKNVTLKQTCYKSSIMKNSRLACLFKVLDNSELRAIKKLLKPPPGRKASELFRLFEFFYKKTPLKKRSRLKKEHVFTSLFPQGNYDDNRLNKLANQLVRFIEDFLVQQQFKKDKALKYQALACSLSHREDSRYFEVAMKKWEQAIAGPGDSLFAYLSRFLLSIQHLSHHQVHENNDSYKTVLYNARERLNELNHAWQLFFELERIARGKYVGDLFPPARPALTIEMIEALDGREELLMIRLCQKLYLMSAQPDVREYFDVAWEALRLSCEQLSSEARLQVLRYLLNHCIARYFQGAGEFLQLQLNLYKWGVEKQVFIQNDMIEDTIFMNAVITAATAGDFKFAEEFITGNKPYIIPSRRKATGKMAHAYLYFHREEYEKAVREIDKLRMQDYDFAIRRQSLLLRATYKLLEQGRADFGDVMDRYRTYTHFFERDSYDLAEGRKQSYLNLAYYVYQMACHHPTYGKEAPKPVKEIQAELAQKVPAASTWVKNELALLSAKKGN